METLILYCDTGGGHHTAAFAMADELKKRGQSVTMLDPFELAGKHTAVAVGNSYIKLVQHSPKSFGAMYALGEAYDKLPIHSPVYWANGKMTEPMERYLQAHSFDCIVMTHTFPAQILAHLDMKEQALFKKILIATDYTCTPFFEESHCDYYGIPAPDLKGEFVSKGIPEEKIWTCGIPVRRSVREAGSKGGARKKLGWSEEERHILLSGGSMGAGHIVKAVAVLEEFLDLNPQYQLTVICGSNRKLYGELMNHLDHYDGRERVHVLGFTDKMAEYMKAADIFITKPGGLSSTEAAVCGVPLIHFSPIPGCESLNARYFSERGMSLYVSRHGRDLLEAVEKLRDKDVSEKMAEAQRRYINPDAASDLCDAMEAVCSGK